MKLQRVEPERQKELECLGEEIRRLRQPGRHLMLPGDLKVRICRLHQAGVTLAEIRRVTGVESASIKAWMKKSQSASTTRPFKVVTVEEPRVECQQSETLTFRFASGKVTVEVALSALSPELLRVLTSC
jgi:hypothetical protein